MPEMQRITRRKPIASALGRIAGAIKSKFGKRQAPEIPEQAIRDSALVAERLKSAIARKYGPMSFNHSVNSSGCHKIAFTAPPHGIEREKRLVELTALLGKQPRKQGVAVENVRIAGEGEPNPKFTVLIKAMRLPKYD